MMPAALGVGKVQHSADVTARLLPAGQGEGCTIGQPGDVGPTAAAFPSGEGRFALTVETSGTWIATVAFSSNRSGIGSRSSFSGTGGEVTRLFSLSQRGYTFSYSSDLSATYFYAGLVDVEGYFAGSVAYFDADSTESDPQSGGTLIVPGPGTYLLQVYSDAAWAISID